MLITRDMIITGVTCCLISACRSEHKLGVSGTPTPQSIVSSTGGLSEARKASLWIDRELKLPTGLALYDGANVLLESHRFKGIRVNQKLGDKIFSISQ